MTMTMSVKNDSNHVNYFDYKIIIITKIDASKDYVVTTHVLESSLKFAIYYFVS
jgi:hypothetical protein